MERRAKSAALQASKEREPHTGPPQSSQQLSHVWPPLSVQIPPVWDPHSGAISAHRACAARPDPVWRRQSVERTHCAPTHPGRVSRAAPSAVRYYPVLRYASWEARRGARTDRTPERRARRA
jgi:hypothetical protein